MHRILLLTAFITLFFAPFCRAQFSKGDRLAGTSIALLSHTNGTSEESNSIGTMTNRFSGYNVSLNPSMGWFISDATAVGASFVINPSSQTNRYSENGSTFQKDKYSTFGVGAGGFVRQYLPGARKLMPFAQLTADAGITTRKTSGFLYVGTGAGSYKDTYTGKSSGGFFANASGLVGVTKMLGSHVGLDLYLGYQYGHSKITIRQTTERDYDLNGTIDETRPKETTTVLNTNRIVLGVGFQVFLPGKK